MAAATARLMHRSEGDGGDAPPLHNKHAAAICGSIKITRAAKRASISDGDVTT
jgi:hypothetical protein